MADKAAQLSELIRQRRRALSLSQTAVAHRVGRSQRWVSALELGTGPLPRAAELERLADALQVDPVVLLAAMHGRADTCCDRNGGPDSIGSDDPGLADLVDIYRELSPAVRAELVAFARQVLAASRPGSEDAGAPPKPISGGPPF